MIIEKSRRNSSNKNIITKMLSKERNIVTFKAYFVKLIFPQFPITDYIYSTVFDVFERMVNDRTIIRYL